MDRSVINFDMMKDEYAKHVVVSYHTTQQSEGPSAGARTVIGWLVGH